MKHYIQLNSMNEVTAFLDIMEKYDLEAELISGRFCVDAKSILGVLSLGLKKKLILNVYGKNDEMEQEIDAFSVQ